MQISLPALTAATPHCIRMGHSAKQVGAPASLFRFLAFFGAAPSSAPALRLPAASSPASPAAASAPSSLAFFFFLRSLSPVCAVRDTPQHPPRQPAVPVHLPTTESSGVTSTTALVTAPSQPLPPPPRVHPPQSSLRRRVMCVPFFGVMASADAAGGISSFVRRCLDLDGLAVSGAASPVTAGAASADAASAGAASRFRFPSLSATTCAAVRLSRTHGDRAPRPLPWLAATEDMAPPTSPWDEP
jgi:hypothetical protein